jgi:hypothetical protein
VGEMKGAHTMFTLYYGWGYLLLLEFCGGGGGGGGVKNCGNCLQIKSSAKWEIPVTENIYNSMKIKFNAKKNSSSYSDYVLLIKSYSNIHIIFKQRSESHNVL